MREDRAGDRSPPSGGLTKTAILPFPTTRTASRRVDGRPSRTPTLTPNNLPAAVSSFVGRQSEMTEVKRLLAQNRLLTLTGAGGVGKTRLAREVAAELLQDYPDGVCYVEFAPLADPTLVPHAVAGALGVRDQPGRPVAQVIVSALASRRLLLVLDNCEHLILACAALAEDLLRGCPRLRVLATSRQPLSVGGEAVWRVPSLPFPDPHLPAVVDRLIENEAVRLFVERAVAARSDFVLSQQQGPLVADMCRRLDGIPLAIELAAARAGVLGVAQIAERLGDRFRLLTGGPTVLPRHQTLRAAVDWSYDLLDAPGRVLLRRLSVFAGGFTLEAAEAVGAGNGIAGEQVLDLLAQLVARSLVLADEDAQGRMRYRLLETIRQYGEEKLRDAGEERAVHDRHLAWFARIASEGEHRFWGSDCPVWLDTLDAELANIRAALEWGRTTPGAAEAAVQLGGSLWRFWDVRSHLGEAVQLLEVLIPLVPPQTGAAIRALFAVARARYDQGDLPTTEELCIRIRLLAQQVGDNLIQGLSAFMLGEVACNRGDLEAGRAWFAQTLDIARDTGDPLLSAMAPGWNGYGAMLAGEYELAASLLDEALELLRKHGEPYVIAAVLSLRGNVAALQGDLAGAEAWGREAMSFAARARAPFVILSCFEHLAGTAFAQGRMERSAGLSGAMDELQSRTGIEIPAVYQSGREQRIANTRAALGDDAFDAACARGAALFTRAGHSVRAVGRRCARSGTGPVGAVVEPTGTDPHRARAGGPPTPGARILESPDRGGAHDHPADGGDARCARPP